MGQLIFGASGNLRFTAQAAGVPSTQSARILRGTLTADATQARSRAASGGYTASVLIDGDEEPGDYGCDMPYKRGQRVQVISFGGSSTIVPIGSVILANAQALADAAISDVKTELQKEIESSGAAIKSEVEADVEKVQQAAQAASDKADAAQSSAQQAAGKADAAQQGLTDVKATVTGLEGDVGELSTRVEGAVSDASSALTAATEAKQTATEVSTTATQAYETAGEALTQSSSAVQTATQLKTTVEQNYLSKEDAGTTYATKSQLTQTAADIRSEVAETYATQSDLDGAVAQEVLDRNSAISQSAASIQQTVSQTYQSKTDAGTMQQALQSQITQNAGAIESEVSARTAAVSGAVKESKSYTDQKADSITQTVADTYQTKAGMSGYATTSALQQTSESLTATFTEALTGKGKTYIGQPKPPYSAGDVWIDPEDGVAYTCKASRASGSYSASDWTQAEAFVSAFIRQDVDGVTVGRESGAWKARVSSGGTFDILDSSDDVAVQFGAEGDSAHITTALSSIVLLSNDGMADVIVGNGSVQLDSAYGYHISQTPSSITNYSTLLTGCKLLFSSADGEDGTVQLMDDIDSFEFIDIMCEDSGGRCFTERVYGRQLPSNNSGVTAVDDGTKVSVSRAVGSNANSYLSSEIMTLSGKAITRSNQTTTNINSNGTIVGSTESGLTVHAVVGWST